MKSLREPPVLCNHTCTPPSPSQTPTHTERKTEMMETTKKDNTHVSLKPFQASFFKCRLEVHSVFFFIYASNISIFPWRAYSSQVFLGGYIFLSPLISSPSSVEFFKVGTAGFLNGSLCFLSSIWKLFAVHTACMSAIKWEVKSGNIFCVNTAKEIFLS